MSPTEGEGMATVIPFPRVASRSTSPISGEKAWTGTLVDLDAARTLARQAGAAVDKESEESPRVNARELAIKALAVKGRSAAEIRARLVERGVDPEQADHEVARLESEGLINDQQLADDLALTLSRVKKLGPTAIRQALTARQIPRNVVDSVIDNLPESHDSLRELAESRLRQLGSMPPEVQTRRLIGFLARRGYTGHEVYRTVDSLVSGQ